jgi:protein-disulfide isomerase/Skp family chaperone for outer membrane proteins
MKSQFRSWSIAACLLLLAIVACAQSQSKTVAVLNGESITEEQLQKAAAPALERLEQKRQQFNVTLERDKKSAVADALDDLVNDKVLAAEAKKRNISVNELVQQEVDNKVTVPAEETIRKFYDDNKAVINGSFVETALQIRNYLMQENRDRTFGALIAKLRNDYGFKSMLEPDRIQVATQGHPSKGPAGAPVTIVEFSDFECPYCGGLFPTLRKIEENYKDKIRIVYRQFPLNNLHPHAQKAAEASLCANDQNKFWQLHDAMFSDQKNLTVDDLKAKASALSLNAQTFSSCLESGKYAAAIRDSIVEGSKVGVDGTPALFINGRFLGGNQPYDEIAKIIDDELLRSGK